MAFALGAPAERAVAAPQLRRTATRCTASAAAPARAALSARAVASSRAGLRATQRARRSSVAGAARADIYGDSQDGMYVDLCPGFAFFKVEAIVRPWRLPGVISALSAGGIRGVTAYEVKGLGAQDGVRERYQGQEFDDATLVSKSKVEIVCVASQVNDVVNLIVQAAQTGETGDGKVFISPVSDVIRIRTAEHGAAAERMKGGREDMTRAGRAASS